jgi:NAD(P)-dependent dehydrogenase (short-subunit alcohol dehydrogenase family)
MEKEVAPIPLHSHVQPSNIAEAVRFLLSPQSDFINGANIVLDGGLTVSY